MKAPKILAIVLSGGAGKRLQPLTTQRSKPAVPFGGRYRIVDFVLSNFVNSGIWAIYLLVQYKSQSLIEHVDQAWVFTPLLPDQFVTVVPAQMWEGPKGPDHYLEANPGVVRKTHLKQAVELSTGG